MEWTDIQSHTQSQIAEKNTANCWTIGYLEDNGNELIVKYGGTDDGDYCFDAIPKEVITKVTAL